MFLICHLLTNLIYYFLANTRRFPVDVYFYSQSICCCYSDKVGKEVVSRFSIYGMETKSTFYTDSNGREMLQRVRNHRPTFNFTHPEPISGNYYPVTTRIALKDETKQFSVITDRSQGGTSLHDGEIEIMVGLRLFSSSIIHLTSFSNKRLIYLNPVNPLLTESSHDQNTKLTKSGKYLYIIIY